VDEEDADEPLPVAARRFGSGTVGGADAPLNFSPRWRKNSAMESALS
jgi:hypothetical protein